MPLPLAFILALGSGQDTSFWVILGSLALGAAILVAICRSIWMGSCALDIKEFVNGLNDVLKGKPDGVQISDALTELTECVGDALGYLVTHPGKTLQG